VEDSSQREEIGVSPSLLSRLRNGLKPDTDSFATIVRWLGIPAERFFVGGAQEEVNPHDDDDLMRQFVPLLRAQKNLSEEDKQYLEQIVSVTLKHVRGKEK